MSATRWIGLCAASACFLLSCSPPADPLAYGKLCYPERFDAVTGELTCPSLISVQRPNPFGRNAIDFALTNKQALGTEAFVLAGPAELLTSSSTADLGADAGDLSSSSDSLDIFQFLGQRRYPALEAGATARGRFVPTELGRSKEVALVLDCGGVGANPQCDLELEYVFIVEPNECAANEDCDGAWICDTSRAECVECVETAQCSDGQTCELGRCTPERVTATCASLGSSPVGGWGLWLLALALVRVGWRRRRRLRGSQVSAVGLCVMLAALMMTSSAQAQTMTGGLPAGPTARFDFSVGPRFFTGQLGELTDVGVGFNVRQGVRGTYFGGDLTLTAAYFATKQSSPPASRSLMTYSAQVGPRAYLPLGPIELFTGVSYERLGLAANSLVRITGEQLSYHAVDGVGGIRTRFGALELELEGQYHWLFGLPGQLISVNLTVGFIGS